MAEQPGGNLTRPAASSSTRERRSLIPLGALFGANAISMSGNVMALVAIPWFVLETTGSATLTGVVAFSTAVPSVIAAFFGGALADRVGYRRLSIAGDIVSAVAVALIPALYQTVGLQTWLLIVLVFTGTFLDAPGTTARRALIPDVAARGNVSLERASGIAQAVQRGSSLLGAPVGGGLIALFGASNVLWIDAASYVVSAALIALFIPRPKAAPASRAQGFARELVEGVRFLFRDRLILAIMATVLFTNFLDSPIFSVILPVYAQRFLHNPLQLGGIIATFGAASLLGAVGFSVIGQRLPRRLTFGIGFALAGLPMWLLATTPSFLVAAAAMGVIGLASGPVNPIISTIIFERVPVELRGRVLGVGTAGAYVAIPLGALAAGFAVDALGIGGTFAVMAAAWLIVSATIWFNPGIRQMDAAPDQAASSPAGPAPEQAT